MRFSETFKLSRDSSMKWFDPILTIDTKLFIDPFLLYQNEDGFFNGSHAEVIEFFNDVFFLISRTGGDQNHLFWKRAKSLLVFPEVQELCLGFASGSTKGAGSGTGFSKVIAEALWEAVEAGIKQFSHFEEVGILREGIGADRISDITANLLRYRFAAYTLDICKHYGIKSYPFIYNHGKYNHQYQRWMPERFDLPQKTSDGSPILLCPSRYLRDLPTISANNFWDYCFINENETIRNDYGADITRNVDKKTIIEFARHHSDLRQQYIKDTELQEIDPYDFKVDKRGLTKWYDASAEYCNKKPLALLFSTEEKFILSINNMMAAFKNFIENNRGWSLLWNDNKTPKSEEAAQLLFLGIVKHYCQANNIDISKEVNIGRGPVDFKASQGSSFRSLLELKLAKNSKFWNGLEKQLPKYLEAEGVSIGYFIIIVYSEKDFKKISELQLRIREINDKTGYAIKSIIINAQYGPPSASKL
jgi:hypothetical protein